MNKLKKNNVFQFPEIKITDQEKEIEAVLFASNIPLDLETIESKITKKMNIENERKFDQIIYYFERHIEVDGDSHGPMALDMIKNSASIPVYSTYSNSF